jgi:hypothetical protein
VLADSREGVLGEGLAQTEHVLSIRGMDVEAESGSETLAHKVLSYFDRTYRHFSSHRQDKLGDRR